MKFFKIKDKCITCVYSVLLASEFSCTFFFCFPGPIASAFCSSTSPLTPSDVFTRVHIVSVCALGVHACEGGRYPEEGARHPLYHSSVPFFLSLELTLD